MKLKQNRTVEGGLAGLEKHKVGIATNGKAFTTLVKGIYENKIRSFVREITTNALDAHVEADCPERPFKVEAPDDFDPYFRVRDFGPSMTHDVVFNIFGTLFASTKDDSNEVVGAFGLGSKSPLSYSDAFEVTAYLDGERRTYLVAIDADGVPELTLLTRGDTTEENGLEVAIPIAREDFTTVIEEAKDVLSYFPIMPITTGFDVEPVVPAHSLANDTVHIIKINDGNRGYGYRWRESKLQVRMGCVVYPVEHPQVTAELSKIDSKYDLLLDVELGSVSVTTSREALELDPDTIRSLTDQVNEAIAAIQHEVESQFRDCNSLLEARELWLEAETKDYWKGQLTYNGTVLDPYVDLSPKKGDGDDIVPVVRSEKSRQHVKMNTIDLRHRDDLRIVIGHPNSVVRGSTRYREFVDEHSGQVFLWAKPNKKAMARLVKLAGLTNKHFVRIESLPDPGPAKRSKVNGGRKSAPNGAKVARLSGYEQATEMPEDFYWVVHTRPNRWNVRDDEDTRKRIVSLGGDDIPIVCFTESVAKRMKLEEKLADRRLHTAEKELCKAKAEKLDDDAIVNHLAYSSLTYEARSISDHDLLPNRSVEVDSYFHYLPDDTQAEYREKAAKKVADLRELYPLLFDQSEAALRAYVDSVNAANDE